MYMIMSMIGYSERGNLVVTTYNLFMEEDLLLENYERDEIDNILFKIGTLELLYPKLMFINSSKLNTMDVGFNDM